VTGDSQQTDLSMCPPGMLVTGLDIWADDRVARFEFTGEPEWALNNTLHGLAHLPVRAIAV
jgi:hypothetical protein